MIQLVPQLRILLACKPIYFCNWIDGLATFCNRELVEIAYVDQGYTGENAADVGEKGVLLANDTVGEPYKQSTYAFYSTEYKELTRLGLSSPTVSANAQKSTLPEPGD